MNKLNVQRFASASAAAAAAGEALHNWLSQNSDQPLLLLLSAGSALGILDGVNPENLGEHVTISMLDERFSSDPEANNFLKLQKTPFYQSARQQDCNFYGTLPRPKETKEQLAKRLEENFKNWRNNNPNGKIMATIGMGSDGHIAGIFPFPESADEFRWLFESQTWIVAYNVGQKHQYKQRITATGTFFKFIDFAVAYVCGREKKVKLNELLAGKSDPYKLPAQIWRQIKNVQIFTDLE